MMPKDEKLERLKNILSWYGVGLSIACDEYIVMDLICEMWDRIKPREKKDVLDILFQ